MPKYIKKVTAQKCPIHQAVLEACGQRLVEKGYFSKDNVINALRFQAVEASIRWDYIADFLQDPELGVGIQIVPLAPKFFASTSADRLRDAEGVDDKGKLMNLGKYLAGGHSRKTAGYARASFEGGMLAVKRAQNYASMRNGVGTSFEDFRKAVLADKSALSDRAVQKLEDISSSEAA
jgi:hypothetical protein